MVEQNTRTNENFKSKAVKKLVKKALNNQDVKKEYNREKGVDPIDIGKKSISLPGNKVLIKAGHGRYLVEVFQDKVDVLGIGDRGNNGNMEIFQDLMNEIYD